MCSRFAQIFSDPREERELLLYRCHQEAAHTEMRALLYLFAECLLVSVCHTLEIVSDCQVQNFTADAEVHATLAHIDRAKWNGKLDYMLSTMKRRIVDANVPGAIAELGIHEGRTSHMIRRFINAFASDREFHVFDSFKGLPDRQEIDGPQFRKMDGKGGMAGD